MAETRVLLDGLGFPESTRWRDGRLWLCNWGAGEVLAVPPGGEPEVMTRLAPQTLPFSIDWLPDGRLLVVDGPERLLRRQEPDGTLAVIADLTGFGSAPFNELVVDVAGNAYVNGGPGIVVLVGLDGGVREVADGLRWPNGMAFVDEGRTLVVADSHAEQLVGFDVAADGTLSGRRIWAALVAAPDGICADAEGAVWVASVPGQHCVRVRARYRDRRSRLFRMHAGRLRRSDALHRRRRMARDGGRDEGRAGSERTGARGARAAVSARRPPMTAVRRARSRKRTPTEQKRADTHPFGMAPAEGLTGRSDTRPGGSYRMVLSYADASTARGQAAADSDVVEARFVDKVPGVRVVQAEAFPTDDPGTPAP